MPDLICTRCSAGSYVTAAWAGLEPCPVCRTPLTAGGGAPACDRRDVPASGDAQLARRHRAGDPDAFTALHARYAVELRAHARRVVGDAHAEDMVQEAFVRAHRFMLHDPRAVHHDLSLRAWLHTVVRHRCLDELRRTRRPQTPLDEDATAGGHGPLALAVQAEELLQLGRAVAGLPRRQRQALVQHVLDGEPHAVVARRLHTTVPATKSLINRARSSLRHTALAINP
ncbi:sigma-70 family RNA polymerase sigma factor [Paraconexibacter sp. AEG42_29]|uniref:RNA polymerase sigma factor n=1 Tax=Paraconexibacter sp. AEG42_29 TaxID=2997339 RepID=UPI00339D8363